MDRILQLLGNVGNVAVWLIILAVLLVLFVIWRSLWTIGPTEVGLVRKRFSMRKNRNGGPVAFNGEAGYQADLLMAGLQFKLWPLYTVTRHPMVQIPAGHIGVVVAQVGDPLPIGSKSAAFKTEFGNFQDIRAFVQKGGQKGVQRPVLPPGTVAPIHPVGFIVIGKTRVYGVPVAEEYPSEGMRGRRAALRSPHMQPRPGVIDLLPPQIDQFRSPQAMPKGQQDHGGIAVPLAVATGRIHQLLDFGLSQVLARAEIGIFTPQWRNCPIYNGWRYYLEARICHGKSRLCDCYCMNNSHFMDSTQPESRQAERRLRKYGCTPDLQYAAAQNVLQQEIKRGPVKNGSKRSRDYHLLSALFALAIN